MSCEACEESRDNGIAYYRWGKANVGMMGCKEHLREIFNVLTKFQSAKNLVQSTRLQELIKGDDHG